MIEGGEGALWRRVGHRRLGRDGGDAQWLNDVQWTFFHGPAKVCKDGELEKEDMSAWTRKVVETIRQELLEDVETSNVYTKNFVSKIRDFLKHGDKK